MIGPRHHDTWSTNNTVVLPLHDVIILRKQNDQRGWHWVRSPGWLIVVEFLTGQNDSFIYLPLMLLSRSAAAAAADALYSWASREWWWRRCIVVAATVASAVAAAVATGLSRLHFRRRRLPSLLPSLHLWYVGMGSGVRGLW